jgi:hypothetical protein
MHVFLILPSFLRLKRLPLLGKSCFQRRRWQQQGRLDAGHEASFYVPEIPSDWLIDGTLFPEYQQSTTRTKTRTTRTNVFTTLVG